MHNILQTLCCYFPYLTAPSCETSLPNAAAENQFEDKEEDGEDFKENEYQNKNENNMDTGTSAPPRAGRGGGRAATAGRGRGAGSRSPRPPPPPPAAARANPSADPDGLANAMEGLSLCSRFSPNYKLPWCLQWTPFMDGYQFCYLDFHSVSVHEDAITMSLNEAATEASLKVTVPSTFIGSERIAEEFRLNGPTDVRVAAYTETSDEILKEYPDPTAIMGAPQNVKLPFAVELNFHQEMIWNAGDDRLRDEFWAQNLPAQMMPVLRVTFRSTAKARTGTVKARARTVPTGRNWATPPHRGGYDGGDYGGYGDGADGGGDGGRGDGGFGDGDGGGGGGGGSYF